MLVSLFHSLPPSFRVFDEAFADIEVHAAVCRCHLERGVKFGDGADYPTFTGTGAHKPTYLGFVPILYPFGVPIFPVVEIAKM
jgi:hypothetical protein